MNTVGVKNKKKSPLGGKSLNQLINESNMIEAANRWLYSKISRSKFRKYPKNKLTYKVSQKRVGIFMSDEGIKKDVIEGILKFQDNIKNVHYMENLSRENGEYTFRIKIDGKVKVLTEFQIYEYEWFMEELSDMYANVDIESIIVKRNRRIANYIENHTYDLSFIRYNIIEKITGGDFEFEKNFKKARNEIKATISK